MPEPFERYMTKILYVQFLCKYQMYVRNTQFNISLLKVTMFIKKKIFLIDFQKAQFEDQPRLLEIMFI